MCKLNTWFHAEFSRSYGSIAFFLSQYLLSRYIQLHIVDLNTRVRLRFFDQVGHETMYASSGNKHFFAKSCHRRTYQNYEQPPRTSQNSYFQSHFSVLKIGRIFLKKKIYEEYLTRRPTFIKFFFKMLIF